MNPQLLVAEMEAAVGVKLYQPDVLQWGLIEGLLGIEVELVGAPTTMAPVRFPAECVDELYEAAKGLIQAALLVAEGKPFTGHVTIAQVGDYDFGMTKIVDYQIFCWLGSRRADQLAAVPIGDVVDFGKLFTVLKSLALYYGFGRRSGVVH
jgi:hypothetical protein